MRELDIERLNVAIRGLLASAGSGTKVAIEERFPGGRMVGGKYSPSSDTITLYVETIRAQCALLFGSEDAADEYALIVFAHELGHAQDGELAELSARLDDPSLAPEERARVALRIEENAWRYASAVVPESREGLYEAIVERSLSAYREAVRPRSA